MKKEKIEKESEIVNVLLKQKIKSIEDFYADPKNEEIIKERNAYAGRIEQFLEENLPLPPEKRNIVYR